MRRINSLFARSPGTIATFPDSKTLNGSSGNVLEAARMLETMLRTFDDIPRRTAELRDLEHRGDELSHDIGRRLESTFVTPFDREDIHSLISGLDDVLDLIEEVGDTFGLYRIEAPTATAVQQSTIVVKQCELLHEAILHLRGFKGLEKYWIEIHRLENEGDTLVRGAIANLFDGKPDPIEVIKWKKIYNLLEATVNSCEDVANIIERIVVKHSYFVAPGPVPAGAPTHEPSCTLARRFRYS